MTTEENQAFFPSLCLCSTISLQGVNTSKHVSSKGSIERLERHVFDLRIETVNLKRKATLGKACERRKALESAKKEIASLRGDAY